MSIKKQKIFMYIPILNFFVTLFMLGKTVFGYRLKMKDIIIIELKILAIFIPVGILSAVILNSVEEITPIISILFYLTVFMGLFFISRFAIKTQESIIERK